MKIGKQKRGIRLGALEQTINKQEKFNENYLSLENTRFLCGISAILVLVFHFSIFNYNYGFLAVGGFFFFWIRAFVQSNEKEKRSSRNLSGRAV